MLRAGVAAAEAGGGQAGGGPRGGEGGEGWGAAAGGGARLLCSSCGWSLRAGDMPVSCGGCGPQVSRARIRPRREQRRWLGWRRGVGPRWI